jgi:geranylgeranyl reductase family protein
MTILSQRADVAVVGAGPAGAHLAFRLAQAGVKVLLLDPKAPWEKPCGGGITHKAWSRFPVLRHADLPRNEVLRSLQISPGRRFFVIDQGHPLLMVSRRALGQVMLQAAVSAGATHIDLAVTALHDDGAHVQVTAGPLTATVDFVVGADGVRSLVRESYLGPLPKERTLGAISQFYEGGPSDPTLIHVTPFPGYCWSFPRTDCLAVGAGAMQHGYDIKGALRQFMTEFFPDRRPLGPPQGALLPYLHNLAAYREPRVGRRWALIGDAAGFVDTLTGEGIGYAVWSADLLAAAILHGRPRAYERAWRKAFGWHLLTGSWVARHIFSPRFIDRFFTAITVCPSLHGALMDFIWNLPPYQKLLARVAWALPAIWREWRAFRAGGGRLSAAALGPFESLAAHVEVTPGDR